MTPCLQRIVHLYRILASDYYKSTANMAISSNANIELLIIDFMNNSVHYNNIILLFQPLITSIFMHDYILITVYFAKIYTKYSILEQILVFISNLRFVHQ